MRVDEVNDTSSCSTYINVNRGIDSTYVDKESSHSGETQRFVEDTCHLHAIEQDYSLEARGIQ